MKIYCSKEELSKDRAEEPDEEERWQTIDEVLIELGTFPSNDGGDGTYEQGYAAGRELINSYPYITRAEVEEYFVETRGIWASEFEEGVIEAYSFEE